MQTALENLSKEDLLKVIASRDAKIATLSSDSTKKDEKIDYLQSQLAMYKRMQFGQKRERFEGDPNQAVLPFEAEAAEVQQVADNVSDVYSHAIPADTDPS